MLSYHNDPALKARFQAHFEQHRAADEVIQGTGFENGRGCFVGCTLDSYDHAQFPKQLGWPEWLARLADAIFEGIPKAEAPQFGTDLLGAVPVGVDLDRVRFVLAIERHEIQLARLESNTEPYAEQCRQALRSVIGYCEGEVSGIYDTESARSAAESAESAAWSAAWSAAESARSAAESAESAAWSAARSAAESAWSAWSAAWSAAESARSAAESAAESARSAAESAESAESAAWSAARSAAESAWSAWSARSAAWQHERDTLLAVLKSLKA